MKIRMWMLLVVAVWMNNLNASVVEPIDPLRKLPVGKWTGTGSAYPFNGAAFDFSSALEIREDGTFTEYFNAVGKDPERGLQKRGRIVIGEKGQAKISFIDNNQTSYEGVGYCVDKGCHFDIRFFIDFDLRNPKKRVEITYREFTLQFSDGGVSLIGSDSVGSQRLAHFVKKMR